MADSVTIEHALAGEHVAQGFTASGRYTAAAATDISITLNGVTKPGNAPFPAGTDAPWSIFFSPGTPAPGPGDLTATIASSGDQDMSDDVEVDDGLVLLN